MAAFGLALSRFVSEVDDHFVCKVCKLVVRSPVECVSCQRLMCGLCGKIGGKCGYCQEELVTKTPALYARKIYSKLQLHCVNSANGCEAVLPLSSLQAHEADCIYVLVPCASPICVNTFLKKDNQNDPDQPLVCSILCKTVIQFKEVLETKDQNDVHKQFHAFLTQAKTLIECQVKADFSPMQQEIEAKAAKVKELAQKREELTQELEERKWKYHPGKWNGELSLWSCCSCADKFAVGCRKLA